MKGDEFNDQLMKGGTLSRYAREAVRDGESKCWEAQIYYCFSAYKLTISGFLPFPLIFNGTRYLGRSQNQRQTGLGLQDAILTPARAISGRE